MIKDESGIEKTKLKTKLANTGPGRTEPGIGFYGKLDLGKIGVNKPILLNIKLAGTYDPAGSNIVEISLFLPDGVEQYDGFHYQNFCVGADCLEMDAYGNHSKHCFFLSFVYNFLNTYLGSGVFIDYHTGIISGDDYNIIFYTPGLN